MVFEAYALALEELKRRLQDHDGLARVWFSDTFVLWSQDDSGQAFAELESAARWFLYFLLQAHIPARGWMRPRLAGVRQQPISGGTLGRP